MKKIRDTIMMLLAICLVAAMMPVQAFAADETAVTVYDENQDPGKERYTGNISEDFYQMDENNYIMPRAITHDNRFDGYTIEKGIDVSKWQADIDWKKVAKDGVKFAIIRVAYRTLADGDLLEDPYYKKNIEGAYKNGIKVGVYIFSQALTKKEARAEADYLMKKIEPYKGMVELPLVMDYEYGGSANPGRLYEAKLSKTTATNNCLAFCERVEAAGYDAMVYANKTFLRDKVYADKISDAGYEIWLAHYTNKTDSTADYTYWQYSSSGSVKGIKGNVDMNFHYINDKNIVRPTLEITDVSTTKVSMKWTKDEKASGYEVWMCEDGGEYELVADPDSQVLSMNRLGLDMGTCYKFKVRAVYQNENGEVSYGNFSVEQAVVTKINYATNITKTASTFDTVTLNWAKVEEKIKGYKIYCYNSSSKDYTLVKTVSDPDTLTYTHTGRNSDTTYKYKIRPYDIVNNTTIWGNYSDVVSVKTGSSGKGVVTGNKISVRKGAGSSYARIAYATNGMILDLIGSTNKWFKISIEVDGEDKTGYISKDYVSVIEIPGKTKLTAKGISYDKVKLTWEKVSGASGYQIQRYNESTGKYTTVKTITSGSTTAYSNGYRDCDTSYKYRIRAYRTYDGTKVYGSYSSAETGKTLGAVKGKTTSSVKVRKSTSTSSGSWTTIKKNKTVTITGKRDGWYRVSVTVNGKERTGYVTSKYVKL